MYQRVKALRKNTHMLQENDQVITGVSGGTDSVFLLFMLKDLKMRYPLELTLVHIHHGIRGDSAGPDERYVKALMQTTQGSGIWHFLRNMEQYAKRTGPDAGRGGQENVGQQIFEKVCTKKEQDGTKGCAGASPK